MLKILTVSVALLSGALVGLGVGGGGIAIIYMTAILAISQSTAQAINLTMYVAAGIAAMSYHARNAAIDLPFVIPAAIGGALAATPSAMLAARLPPDILRRIFGIVMIISALPILFKLIPRTKSRGTHKN